MRSVSPHEWAFALDMIPQHFLFLEAPLIPQPGIRENA
jgi:hypothetical protein